jgi:selenide,water dikinase
LLDAGAHDELHQLLIADAQTSGGLVFGVDPGETAGLLAKLTATGHTAARIGQTSGGEAGFTLS